MPAILYVVATPIGNLEDITLRALRILKEVDFILCEDTRVTKRLLAHYGASTPTISYHQHAKPEKIGAILNLLREGKNLALVSDAGTPGISDPGNELIEEVTKSVQAARVVPVPGASALAAAASVSGFPMDRFLFLGFPPTKKGRRKFFEKIAQSEYPVILYESPHRIVRCLSELQNMLEIEYRVRDTQAVVGRELTKKFETIYRGTISELTEQIKKEELKGEFVVVVNRIIKQKKG